MSDTMKPMPAPRPSRAKLFVPRVNPRPTALTVRKLAVLRALKRLRLADRTQLHRLDGGGWFGFRGVLRELFDEKFIARPRAQLAQLQAHGRRPTVYAISPAGLALLDDVDGTASSRIDNARLGALFIAHTLAVSEYVIAVEGAAKAAGLRLIDQPDCLPLLPEATRRSRHPFGVRVDVPVRGRTVKDVPAVPDRFYKLVWPDDTHHSHFLEYDAGTMPLRRSDHIERQSSIEKKLLVYWHAHLAGVLKQRFDASHLFVLFLTPSIDRLERIMQLQRDITRGGSRLFMGTTPQLIEAKGAFAPIWINGKGEQVPLVPLSSREASRD